MLPLESGTGQDTRFHPLAGQQQLGSQPVHQEFEDKGRHPRNGGSVEGVSQLAYQGVQVSLSRCTKVDRPVDIRIQQEGKPRSNVRQGDPRPVLPAVAERPTPGLAAAVEAVFPAHRRKGSTPHLCAASPP